MKLKKPLSLTFRLTLLFACTSAAVLLVLGFFISSLVQRHFEELDMDMLTGKLELAQHALQKVRSRRDLDALPQQLDASLFGHPGLALLILGPDRKVLVTVSTVKFPQALLEPVSSGSTKRPISWTTGDGREFRGTSALVPTGVSAWPPVVVAVGTDMSLHMKFMASFKKALWLVVILASMLSGLLGWVVVRSALAPVRTIKRRAAEITASHLDQRLAVETVPVELEDLVRTLNAMLARLEESFQRLSEFSADLAHELRTPVTNMRTQTQVILSKPRTAEEYREILYSNEEEFERLSRMIADMLFLAKSDHGLVSPFKEEVDLAMEVRDLVSFFEAMADSKNIRLSIEGEGHVLGDRMLVRRAISNVLSNAIRHTPGDGKVSVLIDPVATVDALFLSIENTGEPIPSIHIPRLFDRFYRVDASRQELSEGTGLGLAIAKSIIDLHGGEIRVQSGDGVTRFEIHFPFR